MPYSAEPLVMLLFCFFVIMNLFSWLFQEPIGIFIVKELLNIRRRRLGTLNKVWIRRRMSIGIGLSALWCTLSEMIHITNLSWVYLANSWLRFFEFFVKFPFFMWSQHVGMSFLLELRIWLRDTPDHLVPSILAKWSRNGRLWSWVCFLVNYCFVFSLPYC